MSEHALEFKLYRLLMAALLLSGCPTPTTTPVPVPAPVASVTVSPPTIMGDSVKFTLTCVAPPIDAGGSIDSCKWGTIMHNGISGWGNTTVTSAFQILASIPISVMQQVDTFQISTQAVRKGVLSSPITTTWDYPWFDKIPASPAIVVTIDTLM